MKILYFDTETTGTDPDKNEIIQFAAIVEVNGEVVDEIDLRCQPTDWSSVSAEALQVTGLTVDELKGFDNPLCMALKLEAFFDRHIDKFDKSDKFYPAGHNVTFDLNFLQSFWKKHISPYGVGSYQNWRALDTRILANFLLYDKGLAISDAKLSTLCEYFNIELDAYDALNDIRATRALMAVMLERFNVNVTKAEDF